MEIHDLQERQSTMDTGVYLPVDDGDITQKIDYPKLARAIIEQYTASSLGGSYRSVKSALDTIKTSVDGAVKTSDVANNVTTTASGKVLDARQGKTLKDGIDTLDSKMELTAVTYTAQYTCAANNVIILTTSDFVMSTPSGYTPLLMTYATTGNNNVLIRAFGLGIGSNILVLRNVSSSDATSTATIRVLYVKYGRI